MSAQVAYTYTESFADIANWTFATAPVDGTFTAGTGASAWKGTATNATGTVPDGKKITAASTAFTSGSSGGVQKGTGNIVLLATGTSDNTTATAIDFFMDFTGLSAGTLSFDWNSVNNSTGDRKASLKIYTSTDGSSFTELTAAQVANFTNNVLTYGSIANINLPASLNGSATARIRFYLYNGTGGTTGSRPKISLDNVKVTATSSVSCSTPSNQPTSLVLSSPSSTSLQGSFTNASSLPDRYLVLLSSNSSLSALPINGQTYSTGDNIGDADVASIITSNSFTVTSLNPSSTYYVYVFSMNAVCSGGPNYQTTNPLTGQVTTGSDIVACTAPTAQPSSLLFSNITTSSLQLNFTASASADEYLVVRSSAASLSSTPNNTQVYNAGDALGGGTVLGRGASTSFIANSLNDGTNYYFFVFAINSQNCTNGPIYYTVSPLAGNASTLVYAGGACAAPSYQPTNLVLSGDNSSISGSFSTSVDADSYLVLYSSSSSLSQTPVNNTSYAVGSTLGNAKVLSNAATNNFYLGNLIASTTYYFYVFAQNSDCSGGTKYLTVSPLQGSRTTTATASYNYYFGNLHAHSAYSDGNKDHGTYTPADDYAYAKNSLGLDFLGISEHNHSGAGMVGSNFPLGVAQATAATTSSFLALYGQEWGVISGGGHALVYGIDSLIGWETNNYQVFVPKSDYTGTPSTTGTTGLFRTLNLQGNAFASYAHPSGSDYNNIYNLPYNATVDSAVIGCAIESGPAFSTSTAYTDYPSSMSFLSYYTKMLSKGYHLGPFMDHDTHYTNFGRANENRLVVLASTLTKTDLFAALKAKRFYATEDIDTRINFTVNNQPMGATFTGNNAPVIQVTATDPSSPSSTPSIKIYAGTPGSGVNAMQLTSTSAVALSYVDNAVANGATIYYYADITINGKRSITAPIWYTRDNCYMDSNNPVATWTGSSNTLFSNAANWCSGQVPPTGSNITIATGSANMPKLLAADTYTINNLVVQTGTSFNLNGGTLKIKGRVLNNGSIDASSGTLEFNGSTAQTIPTLLNSTIDQLTINNAAGVSLNNDLAITGILTLNNGLLATNNHLTLASSATGTATLAAITSGSISGNVTVERYIPAGKRGFRLLAPSVTTTNFIKDNWQEGATSTTSNPVPNHGTHITGSTVDQVNGFDGSPSGNASLFSFSNSTQTWSSMANTNASQLKAGNAYRLLIRGNRSVNLATTQLTTNTATILRATGSLLTGTVSFSSSGSSPASLPSLSSTANQYSFIGNPYASPVDWNALSKTGITGYYYIWDPVIGTRGAYVSCFTDGTKSNASSAITTAIQPGQAFFVQNQSTTVSTRQLQFQESNKMSGNSNVFRTSTNSASIQLQLFLDQATVSQDGAAVYYGSSYANEVDDDDAAKMLNLDENIAINSSNQLLSVERKQPPMLGDTLFIRTWQLASSNYELGIGTENLPAGTTAYLQDTYMGTETALQQTGNARIAFTGSTNAYNNNRFRIVFRIAVLPLGIAQLNAWQVNNGIMVGWNVEHENGTHEYVVEVSLDGTHFQEAARLAATGARTYNWLDPNTASGNHFYRIKTVDKEQHGQLSAVTCVKIGGSNKFSIVPNPVQHKTMQLSLQGVDKGLFTLNLYNHAGQLLNTQTMEHAGGSATRSFYLGGIMPGTYQLRIMGGKHTITKTIVLE